MVEGKGVLMRMIRALLSIGVTSAAAVALLAGAASTAHAGHQFIRPADQNRAIPMTMIPMISRMA
jgi:hypothetical protein